jgi:hypothetical protein
MRRKSLNKRFKPYTAFIPKTIAASKSVSIKALDTINSFFNKTKKTIKNMTRRIDRKTAKKLRSFTRKR